jgi:hypothetical protein
MVHLGGQFGRSRQFNEAAQFFADGPVFGQNAAGLPHQPHRGAFRFFAAHRPQE